MKELTNEEEEEVIKQMAKEFLEQRLGIDATKRNIRCFAAHITMFEKNRQCAPGNSQDVPP